MIVKAQFKALRESADQMPSFADFPLKINVTLLKSEILLYSSKGINEPLFFNRVSNEQKYNDLKYNLLESA